jgi:hypothetical protein
MVTIYDNQIKAVFQICIGNLDLKYKNIIALRIV